MRSEAADTHLPTGASSGEYTFQVRTSPTPGVWLDDVLEVEFGLDQ